MPPPCQALLQGEKYGLMAAILTKKKIFITMEDITTYTKGKQIRLRNKTMKTAFFNVEGLVQCEFLSEDSAFNP
jgi:hypothetical protein